MWWEKSSYAIRTSVRVVGGWPKNCRAYRETVEVSSRDLKTVAISVTRALSNVAGKVIICDKNVSASGGGCGLKNCRAYRETVEVSNYQAGTSKLSQYRSLEKLSQYRSLEQSLKTVEHIEKLSRYRTIEQGLQNCRNIGHLSKVILY